MTRKFATRTSRWGVAATSLAIAMMITGCEPLDFGGSERLPGVPAPHRDEAFEAQLTESLDSRTPLLLSDATDFPWTTVTIVYEGASADGIESITGVRLFDSSYNSSRRLYVFCDRGSVVQLVMSSDLVQANGVPTFGQNARIDWTGEADASDFWLINPGGIHVNPDCG